MKTQHISLHLLLLLVLLSPWCARAGQPQDQFTLILPAPAVHQTLQTLLPLPLDPDSSSFDGSLSIDSIDRLTIHDEIISLHGVVSGKNLTMSTQIAGQNIKLKLGRVILPLSCDLYLRFDQAGQQLFVTPRFKPSQDESARNGEAILPLMAALGNQEYSIDLNKLLALNPTIGGQNRPLQIETVQMSAKNNQLILRFRPKKIKSN